MSVGWFDDIAEADDYFLNERIETEAWDNLGPMASADLYKIKALTHAYNRLYYDSRWDLPTYANAMAAELVILKKANAEMAYYLAVHVLYGDEDRRKGIQAQGVRHAGIVQEDYVEAMMIEVPIPALVWDLLSPWATDKAIYPFNLERAEAGDIKVNRPEDWDPFDPFDLDPY